MEKYIQAFKAADGTHAYGPVVREAITTDFLARFESGAEQKAGESVAIYVCDLVSLPFDQNEAQNVVATIENGEVTTVAGPATIPEVWLHITVAGGDGDDPPGANMDGSNPLQISAALRQAQDSSSAIIPANRSYRITVRTTDGEIYDVRKIILVNGEMGPVSYAGNSKAAVCQVLEADFELVVVGATTYQVRLAQPVIFKFYHDLA